MFLFKPVKPVDLTVKIRCPQWLSPNAQFSLNGRKLDVSGNAGQYAAIHRQWQDGDKLEVKLPMSLHFETLPNDQNYVAFLCGPIVLAGRLGTEGLPSCYAPNQNDFKKVVDPNVPVLVADINNISDYIEPVAGSHRTFKTKGIGKPNDITMVPFYQLHHERYSVYWQVITEEMWNKENIENSR